MEGGFDIIIVTCAAQYAPPDLFKQMKPGGRMIIPIGQPFKRGQVLYVYTKDAEGKIHSRRDIGRVLHPDDRRDDEERPHPRNLIAEAGGAGVGISGAEARPRAWSADASVGPDATASGAGGFDEANDDVAGSR